VVSNSPDFAVPLTYTWRIVLLMGTRKMNNVMMKRGASRRSILFMNSRWDKGNEMLSCGPEFHLRWWCACMPQPASNIFRARLSLFAMDLFLQANWEQANWEETVKTMVLYRDSTDIGSYIGRNVRIVLCPCKWLGGGVWNDSNLHREAVCSHIKTCNR
jgi:hypothetical protein